MRLIPDLPLKVVDGGGVWHVGGGADSRGNKDGGDGGGG